MNLAALATLAAILDKGSFAAAADAVGCTPSAVSMQIKQLEGYFGQPLFDRSARTAKPTALAHEVGALARELLGRIGALRARRSLKVSGRVRLGAIASVQADPLPQVLSLLRQRHPELQVPITQDDSDELLSQLKAGRLDAAVLVRPPAGGSARLAWHDLARQPFVMLAPATAAAATPAELLQRHGWIRYDTALTGGRIAAAQVKRWLPRQGCTMEIRSIDTIVAMVAAGLGVSIVPRPRAPLLQAYAVREVPLGRAVPQRVIAFVRRGADADNRNLDAVRAAFALAYGGRVPASG